MSLSPQAIQKKLHNVAHHKGLKIFTLMRITREQERQRILRALQMHQEEVQRTEETLREPQEHSGAIALEEVSCRERPLTPIEEMAPRLSDFPISFNGMNDSKKSLPLSVENSIRVVEVEGKHGILSTSNQNSVATDGDIRCSSTEPEILPAGWNEENVCDIGD